MIDWILVSDRDGRREWHFKDYILIVTEYGWFADRWDLTSNGWSRRPMSLAFQAPTREAAEVMVTQDIERLAELERLAKAHRAELREQRRLKRNAKARARYATQRATQRTA